MESTAAPKLLVGRSWGICRSSSIKQVESCSTQREMIAETCKRLNLPDPTILEEPQATSGKVPFARRPMGGLLLRTLTKNDTLVAVRIDRLGRSMMDVFQTVETLCSRGVRVFIIRGWGGQAIDLGRATDRLFLMILAWVAETERNMIAERTKDGLAHRRNSGLSAGKRTFTTIQAFDSSGNEIPNSEYLKTKGHYKQNLPDRQWLDQLIELLLLQRHIGARGRTLYAYCAERQFKNRAGKEWWRGTVHVNNKGYAYTNNIGIALKRVRRMAVLGQLPEEYCNRILAITGDTPIDVQPKWKKEKRAAAAFAMPSEEDRSQWTAEQWHQEWLANQQQLVEV